MATITYIGHGSLKLKTEAGTVVYIDPFCDPAWGFDPAFYTEPADLVLVTHQHYDHNAIEVPAKKPVCEIWQNYEAQPAPGDYRTLTLGELTVRAVQAYSPHHKKEACVGYVVTVEGKSIYFAGDTATTEEMKDLAGLGLAAAFLPIDGIYTMDAAEAAACAKLLGAKVTVPYHTCPGEPFSREIAETFHCEGRVILEPGETLTV